MKNPFKRASEPVTTALVQNSAPVDIETITGRRAVYSAADRYIDPLVKYRIHDIRVPNHRHRVAREDALGQLITWMFAMKAWSKFPKFYDSDGDDAVEVMPEVREMCMALDLDVPMAVFTAEVATHGWALLYWWVEPDQATGEFKFRYEIWSENDIRPEDIMRDEATNQPVAWLIRGRLPDLPLNRAHAFMRPMQRIFYKGQPHLVHFTRGDSMATFGYGLSRFEGGWDSITKLREESHSNAFRARVFPIANFPPNWTEEAAQQFMDDLKNWDMMNVMALVAGEDEEGKLYPDLPNFTFISPGQPAPNKNQDSGIQGISSEYVRFCSRYGITVRELSGDPGGAEAAANTDVLEKEKKNIEEFNLYRDALKTLLKQIAMEYPLPLAPAFEVKCNWEYRALDMAAQQAEMMERDMQNQETEADAAASRSNVEPFVPPMIGYMEPELVENAGMEGIMFPIRSSTVKGYGWQDENFYLQFHGSQGTYAYHTGDPAFAQELATGIETSGSPGGWVWDEIRGQRRGPSYYSGRPVMGGTIASQVPYDIQGRTSLSKIGGHKQFEQDAARMRDEKMADFGTARPSIEPNPSGYAGQTAVRSESTPGGSGTLGGSAMRGSFNPGQLIDEIRSTGAQQAQQEAQGSFTTTSGGGATTSPAGAFSLGTVSGSGGGRVTPTAISAGDADTTTSYQKSRGRPSGGARGRPTAHRKPVDYGSYGVNLTNSAPDGSIVLRSNASTMTADLRHAWETANNSTPSETTLQRAMKALASIPVYRENYMAVGNSMSFRDHPYIYYQDGTISVEFPCARDWRANVVGKTLPLWINYDDPESHGRHQVGTITFGWDEETNSPRDVLDYDRESVIAELEHRGNTTNELYRRLVDGEEPDQSTEYYCRNEVIGGKKWQLDFQPLGSCLVVRGNCPSGACDFTPAG